MKKILTILLTVIALIILGGGSFVGFKLYNKYSEGTDWADPMHYYGLKSPELGAVMLDGNVLDDIEVSKAFLNDGSVAGASLDINCRVLNGMCYLDIYTVQKYLHNRFYYSELDREIRYTDATTIVAAPLDGGSWTSTAAGVTDSYEEEYTIAFSTLADVEVVNQDGIVEIKQAQVCYVALEFIEKYVPVTHKIFEEPSRVVIETMELCKEEAIVKKGTPVRWYAGVKSDILTEVSKGEQVVVLDTQVKGWMKIATKDGFSGYVKANKIGDRKMVTGAGTLEYKEPEYTSIQLDEKIRLGFHAVYNKTANNNLNSILETAYNINVISPTWFSLSDNYGGFTHIASTEYVQDAHSKGIQVWGLVEDITNKNSIDTYEILGRSQSRKHLIDGLVDTAILYELDGLNIDFEGIKGISGQHFIQFLRELSIRCRENGLILSVDNYPPNSGNAYYDYEEQGVVADYVVLMGYDEHWGNSGDPGSTSSQPFVESSLDNLLSMVPADKVINALPFYTRLWTTSGETVTDKAVFMKSIDGAVSDYGMIIDYDQETGQKYARAEADGIIYEMWIEDFASMENKLIAVKERDLAGVAAWRLGYEEQAVWELIGNYIR